MSYAAAHTLLRTEFRQWWESRVPQIPLGGDNDDFVPPEDGVWAVMNIIPGDSRLSGLGGDPSSRRWRAVGMLVVQLFVPLARGTAVAEQLRDDLAAQFQGRTFDNVILRDVSLVRMGQQGSWHQFNVVTNYQFDYYG
jgi:hypothetical protein